MVGVWLVQVVSVGEGEGRRGLGHVGAARGESRQRPAAHSDVIHTSRRRPVPGRDVSE